MTRLFTAAALALAVASPAAAQVAGTYSGTSADGNGVSFDVASDGVGGFNVVNAVVFFSDVCKDASILNQGWGYGLNAPIVSRKASDTTANPYFTITFDLKFSNDGQTATGHVTSYSPTLSPVGPTPNKALFCKSAKQDMGVALQPPGPRAGPPAGATILYGAPSQAKPVAGS